MADRRMLWKSVSQSKKVNSLSQSAALLWTWCIPWFDRDGYMEAEPDFIKYNVVPRRRELDESSIPLIVQEIIDSGLWSAFQDDDGKLIVKEKSFKDKQRFEYKKEIKSNWEGKELKATSTRRALGEHSSQREGKVVEGKVVEGKAREGSLRETKTENDHDAFLEKQKEETEEQRKRFSQAFTAKTNRLRSKYPRFNPQLFFQNHLNGHRDAILLCLDRLIEANPPISNPESYCEKIFSVESGNYFEAEAIKKHEEVKKETPTLQEALKGAINNAMSREVP